MSYILEALRRADAERQRGDVPGLHAQPQAMAASEPASARWPLGLVAGAALGLLLLGGALVWWWTGGVTRQAPPPVVAVAPLPGPPAAASAAPLPPPGGAPTAGPLPSPPPVAASVVVPVVVPVLPAPRAAPAPAPATRALPPPPAPVQPVVPAPAAVAPPAAPVRVLKLSELPEDLRRELPAIAPGGSVYAEHAPSRMVILNGQVFHEGDRPAPGLQVQQIRPRSVVFDFKGQRFELPL